VSTGVGVVGVGALGRAFATRLREAAFRVVVHDPSEEARAWAESARLVVAATPRELAAACVTVLLAVPDTQEIFDVLDGPNGLAAGLRRGSTVVVMSTVAPETPLELGRRLGARGVGVVDAPVSGGPEAAAVGALAIMVGGDDAAVAAVRPVLAALGSHVVHVGPAGHGELAKLVNNLIGAAIAVATAEGLALAARAGLDVDRAREAIAGGSGGSWILEHWLPATAFRGDYRRRFGIDLMCKDLGLIAELATALGVDTPALQLARTTFEEARGDGHGGDDFSIVVHRAADRAGCSAFAPRRT
jgi:3-hydroxyisobutyrate dehydrogenase-like beta-hydroxyacid dehydrogenase